MDIKKQNQKHEWKKKFLKMWSSTIWFRVLISILFRSKNELDVAHERHDVVQLASSAPPFSNKYFTTSKWPLSAAK